MGLAGQSLFMAEGPIIDPPDVFPYPIRRAGHTELTRCINDDIHVESGLQIRLLGGGKQNVIENQAVAR